MREASERGWLYASSRLGRFRSGKYIKATMVTSGKKNHSILAALVRMTGYAVWIDYQARLAWFRSSIE